MLKRDLEMNSIIKMDKVKPQRSQRKEVRANLILAFILLIGILFGNGCFQKVDNAANLGFASYVLRILGASKNQNVETPTFTPPAGNYTTDQTIAISTATVGATIYYTLDGSMPTASSTVYTGVIPVAGNGITKMIKAIAIKSGMLESAIGTASYTINYGQVAIPTFTPPAGNYTTDQSVTLSTTTTGATIYYTLDGTKPTASSTLYTGAIPLTGNGISKAIKAIAFKDGASSPIGSGLYRINYIAVDTPTFSPVAALYLSQQNISISTTTVGANIYYTTDGTTPTTGSILYSSPIHIWGIAGRTIKAIATKTGFADSAVATSGIYSYPPLKSGQTGCFNIGGSGIGCPGTGQDGDTQTGIARNYSTPAAHATYTSDYTTKDNSTGLVWKTCSQGLSGATCATGTAATLPNDGTASDATNDATNGCKALNSANAGNGYSGIKTWRLPTLLELQTLVNYGTNSPAIDTTAFPATALSNYWSSNIWAANITSSWTNDFNLGQLLYNPNTSLYNVRCVSGPPKNYSFNFTDNSDGTIKDNATGLIWQKCGQGQNNDASCSGALTTSTFANAISYCNGLSLAGRVWRLPNVRELWTLSDLTKSFPTIDSTAFPATDTGGLYVTSTSSAVNPAQMFGVFFNYGNPTTNLKTFNYNVRCVSGP